MRKHFNVLSSFKDVLFPQCLHGTLATSARASDSTFFVDIVRVRKFFYLLTYYYLIILKIK